MSIARALFRLTVLGFVTAPLLLDASALSSQEIGGGYLHASSGMTELGGPRGFSGYVQAEVTEWMLLRINHTQLFEDTRKEDRVCLRYEPNMDCSLETVDTSATLRGFRFSLQPIFWVREVVRIGTGGGFSFNSLSIQSLGESGREANLTYPRTGQMGLLAIISFAVKPFYDFPLTLSGSTASHWISFNNCVTAEELYGPFCGTTRFQELEVGLSLVF
jgi:hypothetical protein